MKMHLDFQVGEYNEARRFILVYALRKEREIDGYSKRKMYRACIMRMNGSTYKQISERINVCHQRAADIILKAQRIARAYAKN